MDLLIRALISLIENGKIPIPNELRKQQILDSIAWALANLEKLGWSWALGNIFKTIESNFELKEQYKIIVYLYRQYSNSLTSEQRYAYQKEIKSLETQLRERGINPSQIPIILRKDDRAEVAANRYPSTYGFKNFSQEFMKTQSSYSGADMVATINVPGKGPVVFGELSNISYSILREKVPVRALGRVTMKGYTRGMRTISGILTFTVFDESIVYRCMQEIAKAGYRMLMDEMPVFDVTITMANEFGQRSSLTIYGVTTYTEGCLLGVDDMRIQTAYEFFAQDIDPISKLKRIPNSNFSFRMP